MLRSDVQDKLVETMSLMQQAFTLWMRMSGLEDNLHKPSGDTEVAPARRMWKMWAWVEGMFICDISSQKGSGVYRSPVTILPGHDAVEQIERDAFMRGFHRGTQEGKHGNA